MRLLDNKHLSKLNVYDIPKILLDRLDINTNLNIVIRSEILFVSNFMEENKLNTFSDIYYKKNIVISDTFEDIDHDDFILFTSINKYLKTINIKKFNPNEFIFIFKSLTDKNFANLKFIIEERDNNLNNIYEYVMKVKKKNESLINDLNLKFKINYSKEYKKKNFFKQLNLNFIKISLATLILTLLLFIGINYYHEYSDKEKYLDIEYDLKNIIEEFRSEENNEPDFNYIEPNEDDLTTTTTTTTSVYTINYDKAFDKLLTINKDTKGWLSINNTKIDYPVVQTKNNDYYLKHDYYKKKNRYGWIFMDYRNDINNLSKNTVIYGHNLADGTMFGTMRYVLNSSWYKKSSNQVITFNTLNKSMNFQIVSIYKVPVTNDYIQTSFVSDNEFLGWSARMIERSIYNFNQTVESDDNILTLSTCQSGNEQRLVIHAKLIK